ncbi:MAG: M20 family peptidase, partial [Verrucomicrobiota bacterium]
VAELLGDEIKLDVRLAAEPSQLMPDEEFLRITRQVTGEKVKRGRAFGGSDARFICKYGIPVIMSRPLIGNMHAADEWIDIKSMLTWHRICGTFVKRKLGLD